MLLLLLRALSLRLRLCLSGLLHSLRLRLCSLYLRLRLRLCSLHLRVHPLRLRLRPLHLRLRLHPPLFLNRRRNQSRLSLLRPELRPSLLLSCWRLGPDLLLLLRVPDERLLGALHLCLAPLHLLLRRRRSLFLVGDYLTPDSRSLYLLLLAQSISLALL